MTRMGHVHADLVRPTGFEPTFNKRKGLGLAKTFDQSRARYSVTPTVKQYGLTLSVRFVASKMGVKLQDITRLK